MSGKVAPMTVTPLADTDVVSTQLLLVPSGIPRVLDSRTRRRGRAGVAEARRRLAAIRPPAATASNSLLRAG